MSTHVVDQSADFINDEQKLKALINNGFDPERRCYYEALALKLKFNEVIVKIRQLLDEYKDQEFPDMYEHLRMIRAVNETFQDWMMMNVGNISGKRGPYHAGTPRAKSTPKQNRTNQISIFSPKTPNNVGERINQNGIDGSLIATQDSLVTPQSRPHERIFNAVRNFEQTINQLQIPRIPLNSSKTARSFHRKSPKFNVSRTHLPRRRMNFSRSFGFKTPQTN